MRRRVMTVYLTLLVLTCLGLAVPLCVTLADRATTVVVLDRSADATRFASIAERAVITGQVGMVTSELTAYHRLYGIDAMVLNPGGGVVSRTRPGLSLAQLLGDGWRTTEGQPLPAVVQDALAGNRGGEEQRLWPWSARPLVLTEPIVSGGEVVGVVVTSSPTDTLRRGVAGQWALVLAGVVVALALGSAAAGPLTTWVLRPVAELESAATQLAQGDLTARVDQRDGPPELRHLARTFNTMATTITTILDRQRTYVAYAGHQIRNPLAALRLRVEALGAGPAHQLALDEVDRLARTCDALLTLARADEEHPSEVVDVTPVIVDRVRAWEPIAQRAGATVAVDLAAGLQVRTIEGSLAQTLDALLDNALKFGGTGCHVSVTSRPVPEAGSVEIEVSDDGPGLTAQQRTEAVRPFWRAAGQRDEEQRSTAGGSGLGLSIVVTLLELDGGRLSLHAADPHGVRAVISLPELGRDRP